LKQWKQWQWLLGRPTTETQPIDATSSIQQRKEVATAAWSPDDRDNEKGPEYIMPVRGTTAVRSPDDRSQSRRI